MNLTDARFRPSAPRSKPGRRPRPVAPGLLVLVIALAAVIPAVRGAVPMPVEDLFAEPGIFGTPPAHIAWSPGGQRLAFTWARPGEARRSLWIVDAGGEGLRRASGRSDDPVRDLAWHAQGEALLFLRGDGLWRLQPDTDAERRLTTAPSARELRVSPDGRFASWLREGDLWLFDLAEGSERRLTAVGLPPLSDPPTGRYSRAEREIGPGIWGGPTYAWAPDSRTIAVHHVDRRGMRRVSFPNYLAADTDPNYVRRGYPGDPNEARRVGLVSVSNGDLSLLDLDDPTSHQIVGFAWSPVGDLLVDVASDTNTLRRVYVKSRDERRARPVWESRRDTRVYTRFAATWAGNGEDVLVLSDHENFYGIYRIALSGEEAGAAERLDGGDFDVLGAPQPVAGTADVIYAATGGEPSERQVYRLSGDGDAEALTTHAGHHEAWPSPDGRHIALLRSDDRNPPELFLLPRGADTPLRVTHSPSPAFDDFPLAEARYLQLPATPQRPALHLRLLLPADFDAERTYPVLFGPMYSNTVRNRWGAAYTLMQQALAQRGYLVVQVDVRGSTGYGRAFREAFLNDFAGGDIEDIEDAVEYLGALPYVDPERLGIWGSSYGGTLTVYTLLKKPGLFAAGVAAASAVDPAFFGTDDVAIVRRPGDGASIFERRAERLAGNLEDALLLVHGLQDQVVPFKTVASLTDALIRAGKPVETAFLPGATHGWRREPPYDRYVFERLIEFFDRHLKPDATPDPGAP